MCQFVYWLPLNNYKMPREWSNETRDPWNAKIHSILKTIDLHTELHLETGDDFHLYQSNLLRTYLRDLKAWIHNQEKPEKSHAKK